MTIQACSFCRWSTGTISCWVF